MQGSINRDDEGSVSLPPGSDCYQEGSHAPPLDWSKGAAGLKFVPGCDFDQWGCEVINVLPAAPSKFGTFYRVVYRYPGGRTAFREFSEDGSCYPYEEPVLMNVEAANSERSSIDPVSTGRGDYREP